MLRREIIIAILLISFPAYLLAQSQDENQYHIAQQVKDDIVSDLNSKNFDNVTQKLADNVFIILENATFFHSKESLKDFIASDYLLEKYKIKSIDVDNIAIDKTIQSYSDQHFVVTGSAQFTYLLSRAKVVKEPVRWMATLNQNTDRKWQISSYQVTCNVFENPFIDQIRHDFYMICFISLIIGFIIGVVWKKLVRKRM